MTEEQEAKGVDVALVRAAQRGDALAMDQLIELISPYVGRICGYVAYGDDADAMQETLVTVFRKLRRLRDPEALFVWVRQIAIRESMRVAKRSGRYVPTELEDEVPAPGDQQLGSDIADVLARLSPHHRAVLVLRDIEGLDEDEVSRQLEVPPATVRTRLFRARRSFRKEWQQ